jgi:ABC-type branched-subunit amino acid transport system substrate-binding protein
MPQGIGADIAPFVYFKQKYPAAAAHMAVLALNQATDVAETRAEQQGLESLGYNFVYSDYNIELTQTDFSADAQGMKSHGAQGLIMVAIAPYYADVARALQNAGVKMALPDYDQNAYDAAFLADAGDAANGAILWSELALYQGEDAGASPTIALFDKWYKAVSGGASPDEFAAWGWMSGMLFVEGLNAGGGLTRTSLLKGLHQVTSFDAGGFQTAANPVSKTPPACYVIVDVVNQKFVRDPVNPSGFNCTGAPNFYTPKS